MVLKQPKKDKRTDTYNGTIIQNNVVQQSTVVKNK